MFLIFLFFLAKTNLKVFWLQTRLFILVLAMFTMTLSILFSTGSYYSRFTTGLILSLRFVIVISFGMHFSHITDPLEIPSSFIRSGIPHRFGVMLMVAYRMIPLITDHVISVVDVQKSRGASFSFNGTSIKRLVYNSLAILIPIVYSTLETSVGLSDTLLARGYNPYSEGITIPPMRFTIWDGILVLLSILLIAMLFVAN
jgi:energy-coupling factor transporter transmembrane protein EcfT